ncbi:MAG: penicillin-binding protein activator LpoB [Verrucomicrobia bacterium]|nr:penicillin-binding protein activator LpoB [Verrucomicrobiota bacterium]
MKKTISTLIAASILSGLLVGCATPQAKYVEGTQRVVTGNKINVQDWESAAQTMIDSLLDNVVNKGKLQTPPGEPAVFAVSQIRNNTGQHIDTDLLTKKIRIALNQTDKIVTTTTFGPAAEDQIAKGSSERDAFLRNASIRRPDYTLSGKIIEDRVRAGNVRQSSFIFQLSLSDSRGLAIWEDEHPITKQVKGGSVGF